MLDSRIHGGIFLRAGSRLSQISFPSAQQGHGRGFGDAASDEGAAPDAATGAKLSSSLNAAA